MTKPVLNKEIITHLIPTADPGDIHYASLRPCHSKEGHVLISYKRRTDFRGSVGNLKELV